MSRFTNVVQQTTNYDQFSFIENNRETNRGHVEALKTAFEEMGNLTQVQPILVNDRFQIIDGQHRFIAAMELGTPIFFTVVSGLGVSEARNMNILHRRWGVMDYARSYALGGDKNYQKYLNLLEDYGYVHTITLEYVYGGDLKGIFKKFREGDFVLEDEKGARERLDKLALVHEVTALAKTAPFARAFLKAMKVEDFSVKHFIKKVQLHPDILQRMSGIADNLRMIETVYNFGLHEQNKIRLY